MPDPLPPLMARAGRPRAPSETAVERVCPRHGLTTYHRYSRRRGVYRYRAEARKCVLVCANCHGEIECGQIPSPPARARWSGAVAAHT